MGRDRVIHQIIKFSLMLSLLILITPIQSGSAFQDEYSYIYTEVNSVELSGINNIRYAQSLIAIEILVEIYNFHSTAINLDFITEDNEMFSYYCGLQLGFLANSSYSIGQNDGCVLWGLNRLEPGFTEIHPFWIEPTSLGPEPTFDLGSVNVSLVLTEQTNETQKAMFNQLYGVNFTHKASDESIELESDFPESWDDLNVTSSDPPIFVRISEISIIRKEFLESQTEFMFNVKGNIFNLHNESIVVLAGCFDDLYSYRVRANTVLGDFIGSYPNVCKDLISYWNVPPGKGSFNTDPSFLSLRINRILEELPDGNYTFTVSAGGIANTIDLIWVVFDHEIVESQVENLDDLNVLESPSDVTTNNNNNTNSEDQVTTVQVSSDQVSSEIFSSVGTSFSKGPNLFIIIVGIVIWLPFMKKRL